jgi:hypothetical protein
MTGNGGWESDLIDDLITNLKLNGSVMARVNSIDKGLTPDFPTNIGQDKFPVVRITWVGTDEEDSPADNYPERYRTLNLELNIAVQNSDEGKRLDELSRTCEVVANALYDREQLIGALLLDDIELTSTEVAPDVLSHPFGFAIMSVALTTISDRKTRAGR